MYNSHYSLLEYNRAMELRNKYGFGAKKISLFLSQQGIFVSRRAIEGWIYYNKQPFQIKILNPIKDSSKFLDENKAYIFGVLCGDGWVTTKNRFGLNAIDLDFVQEFKRCIFEVYGLNCNIIEREGRKTNYGNGKTNYSITVCSKRAWLDVLKYDSFKTKTWIVPKEILESEDLKIKAAFLRGIFDSEGSIRLRRNGWAHLQVCSGNEKSLILIKDILMKDFSIDMKIEYRKSLVVLHCQKYKDIKNYCDKIGFVIKRKQNRLVNALSTYKRTNLRHYEEEFKLKVFELLGKGISTYKIGKMLNFPYTTIYDFIEQKNRIKS